MVLGSLPDLLRQKAGLAVQALRRHPRRVTGSVLAVLGSFAAAAFGIAPLAPDAALLPQRVVAIELALPDLAGQSHALEVHELDLWRSDVTRNTDSIDTLFRRLGVSDPTAAAFVRTDRDARRLVQGRGGKMVQVRTGGDGTLVELVARFAALNDGQGSSHFTRLRLEKVEGHWQSRLETGMLQAQSRLGSGHI
ncbi:MAG: M23 family peptidase, partial [Aquabacterium sp.]